MHYVTVPSTLCLIPVYKRLYLSSYSVVLNLEIFDISQIRYPRVNGWIAKFYNLQCIIRPSFNLLDSLLIDVCMICKAIFRFQLLAIETMLHAMFHFLSKTCASKNNPQYLFCHAEFRYIWQFSNQISSSQLMGCKVLHSYVV